MQLALWKGWRMTPMVLLELQLAYRKYELVVGWYGWEVKPCLMAEVELRRKVVIRER